MAITPPVLRVDPQVVDVWRDAGAAEVGLAVVLRIPGASPSAIAGELGALGAGCRAAGFPVLVAAAHNDAVGLPAGIDGWHVQGDPTPEQVDAVRRATAGTGTATIVGRSCHGARPAPAAAVDYTCLAPIFAPHTDHPGGAKRPIGLDALQAWAEVTPRVFALGGVDGDRAQACLRRGAHGLAGIHSFFGPLARVAHDVAALRHALQANAAHGTPPAS